MNPTAGRLSFGDFAEGWLKGKTRIKEKTHLGYLSLLDSRILPTFSRSPLSVIDRTMVAAWVRSMANEGLSPSRIRQAHQCLAAILEHAVDEGVIGHNSARRVELPRQGQPDHRFLTADQVGRFAGAMPDHQARTIVYLLAYGGLRWGELVSLRRRRVDILGRRLRITEAATEISGRLIFGTPKTHESRTVHVPSFIAELIGQHLETVDADAQALVFTAPRGGPLRYSNMRKLVWNPARERAGTDLAEITPHDLRHTCASLMRAAGADIKAIQQQLGHRNPTITLNTYTHLFDGDLADVMDRLEVHSSTETRPARVLGEIHRHDTPNPRLANTGDI
ncbi:MAG: site-specific integrase [Actinomycetota bacterium]|nr:site-specific integrase [Actinomycetota bacterium]